MLRRWLVVLWLALVGCGEEIPCQPECAYRECGDDGCGGECDPGCGPGGVCSDWGECTCLYEHSCPYDGCCGPEATTCFNWHCYHAD